MNKKLQSISSLLICGRNSRLFEGRAAVCLPDDVYECWWI